MSGFEPENEGWDETPDLTQMSQEDLKGLLQQLVAEEREVSYRRRLVQGKIDLIRAELVRRGGVTLSPEELARVLMGDDRPGSSGEQPNS